MIPHDGHKNISEMIECREAALGKIKEICESVEYKVKGKPETYDQFHEGASATADAVLTVLDELI